MPTFTPPVFTGRTLAAVKLFRQQQAIDFTEVYDRYGNRWQQNVTAGSGPQFQIGFDKGNNRDCDGCYDAAGIRPTTASTIILTMRKAM